MIDHNRRLQITRLPPPPPFGKVALAAQEAKQADAASMYNQAGDDYLAYADGNPAGLFDFDGPHAYADRRIWETLASKLAELRASGASAVTLLDAGCGPGTWLRRLVIEAHALGFTSIRARGFDIAEIQVQRARSLAANVSNLRGVTLAFDVADLSTVLPEPNKSVDLSICLYSVLSHLPVDRLPGVVAELARVTSGYFFTAVRATGSMPTAFVDSIDQIRKLKHDHVRNRCQIELGDGRHAAFDFHLFGADELRDLFAHHFEIEDLRGLDLFHTRFAPDPRWNPAALQMDSELSSELARLEELHSTNPALIDRATHLLLAARHRRAPILKTCPDVEIQPTQIE